MFAGGARRNKFNNFVAEASKVHTFATFSSDFTSSFYDVINDKDYREHFFDLFVLNVDSFNNSVIKYVFDNRGHIQFTTDNMILAITNKKYELIKYLLKNNIINYEKFPYKEKNTSYLHEAVLIEENDEIVKYLIKHLLVNLSHLLFCFRINSNNKPETARDIARKEYLQYFPKIEYKNILLLGSTQSGKSSLINSLIKYQDAENKYYDFSVAEEGNGVVSQTIFTDTYELSCFERTYSYSTKNNHYQKITNISELSENNLTSFQSIQLTSDEVLKPDELYDKSQNKKLGIIFKEDTKIYYIIKLIDTPGLFDTNTNDDSKTDQSHTFNVINKLNSLNIDEIHGIVIVKRYDSPYSKPMKEMFAYYQKLFRKNLENFYIFNTRYNIDAYLDDIDLKIFRCDIESNELINAGIRDDIQKIYIDSKPNTSRSYKSNKWDVFSELYSKQKISNFLMQIMRTNNPTQVNKIKIPKNQEMLKLDEMIRKNISAERNGIISGISLLDKDLAATEGQRYYYEKEIDSIKNNIDDFEKKIKEVDNEEKYNMINLTDSNTDWRFFGNYEAEFIAKNLPYPIKDVDDSRISSGNWWKNEKDENGKIIPAWEKNGKNYKRTLVSGWFRSYNGKVIIYTHNKIRYEKDIEEYKNKLSNFQDKLSKEKNNFNNYIKNIYTNNEKKKKMENIKDYCDYVLNKLKISEITYEEYLVFNKIYNHYQNTDATANDLYEICVEFYELKDSDQPPSYSESV